MTDDEIISVVQAHKEGKRIQMRHAEHSPHPRMRFDDQWIDLTITGHIWDFTAIDYRVAPTQSDELITVIGKKETIDAIRNPEPLRPREWSVNIRPDGRIISWEGVDCEANELIRVREVIE